METFELTKLSAPGWVKRFNSEKEARNELYKWICGQCKEEYAIRAYSTIDDLLWTDCGCEFDYEYTDSLE